MGSRAKKLCLSASAFITCLGLWVGGPADAFAKNVTDRRIELAEYRPTQSQVLRKKMIKGGRGLRASEYRDLADSGDGLAAYRFAKIIMDDPRVSTRNDALHYFSIAVNDGKMFAIKNLLSLLADKEVATYRANRLKHVQRVLMRQAKQGNADAIDGLIAIYQSGDPFGKNDKLIKQLLSQQIYHGDHDAALRLVVLELNNSDLDNLNISQITEYLEFAQLSASRVTKLTAIALLEKLKMTQGDGTSGLSFFPQSVGDDISCLVQISGDQVLKFWSAWDRKELPNKEIGKIKNDVNRLIQKDAVENASVVKDIISKLSYSPSFTEADSIVALLKLHIAAGNSASEDAHNLFARLTQIVGSASPVIKNYYANLILENDFEGSVSQALELKIAAASEKDASATLELLSYLHTPIVKTKWGINKELTSLIALARLMGETTEEYCRGAKTVATQFAKGEHLEQDLSLSETWYKHLADLGDVNTAWKVAKLHLQKSDIDRDADAFVHHLLVAAHAGNASAIKGAMAYSLDPQISSEHLLQIEEMLREKSEAGNEFALNALSQAYRSGTPFGLKPADFQSILMKRVELGSSDAALQLALSIMSDKEQNSVKNDMIKTHLKLAAESENLNIKSIAFNLLKNIDASEMKTSIINE